MDGKVRLGKYVAKMTAQWCVYMMLISVFMILVSYMDGAARFWREGAVLEGISFLFPLDLYMMAVVSIPIMAGSMCKVYFPIYVSMGFTRKKAFGCVVAVETVTMTAIFLIVNVLWRITGVNLGLGIEYVPAMLAALVVMGGLGMLFGGIVLRFGTKGAVIFMLTFVGVSGIAGFAVMFAGVTKSAAMKNLNMKNLEFLSSSSLGLAVLVLGILIFGVCCFIAWRLMRRTEVRL